MVGPRSKIIPIYIKLYLLRAFLSDKVLYFVLVLKCNDGIIYSINTPENKIVGFFFVFILCFK